ncbi:hypothetical protein [uncultured Secundilactobacillus sp.]|uniref:hypothetical protein n=1 Tax=uncultured Secundilactobacillus sp. TaxID=2813935 RepID=UPI002585CBC9|nr:hypothetical protein [uncultured Secundilactobacillus sp.]
MANQSQVRYQRFIKLTFVTAALAIVGSLCIGLGFPIILQRETRSILGFIFIILILVLSTIAEDAGSKLAMTVAQKWRYRSVEALALIALVLITVIV